MVTILGLIRFVSGTPLCVQIYSVKVIGCCRPWIASWCQTHWVMLTTQLLSSYLEKVHFLTLCLLPQILANTIPRSGKQFDPYVIYRHFSCCWEPREAFLLWPSVWGDTIPSEWGRHGHRCVRQLAVWHPKWGSENGQAWDQAIKL